MQPANIERAEFLDIWVVFNSPVDFPGKFVARKQTPTSLGVLKDLTENALVADTLDGVRAMLPPHLSRLPRHVNDAPGIVEVWL